MPLGSSGKNSAALSPTPAVPKQQTPTPLHPAPPADEAHLAAPTAASILSLLTLSRQERWLQYEGAGQLQAS